eukprot:TRINITY_DN953_c0_g1_i1.p1 TRINITY_DN953_c0_g1~~TRINITY_DN953_c0_g1_i1.p1  ORF type:complete len:374 (+),score=124.67 TRINITY_DN953_c0_g1_i1:81-1124(+)
MGKLYIVLGLLLLAVYVNAQSTTPAGTTAAATTAAATTAAATTAAATTAAATTAAATTAAATTAAATTAAATTAGATTTPAPVVFSNCNKGKAYIGQTLNSMIGRPTVRFGSAAPFSCDMSEAEIASTGAARAYAGSNRSMRWYIGEVANRSNSNPIVAHFNAGMLVWCRTDFVSTADQVIGYGLLFNDPDPNSLSYLVSDALYAVFSSRGLDAGTGTADFRRFTTNGWLANYGSVLPGSRSFGTGSAKVSIVAKLNPQNGAILASTYLNSKRLFGTTGDFTVNGLTHIRKGRTQDETLVVFGTTRAAPLRADKTRMKCRGAGPYSTMIALTADLTQVVSSWSPDCA